MKENIKLAYKGSRIEFDFEKEEWVAYLGINDSSFEEFKRHTSLKKLKDAIDRFNKKEFKPIPILYFNDYRGGKIQSAEIISFTQVPGECWIRKSDDTREKICTVKRGYNTHKKIYACENINNESIFLKIRETEDEINKLRDQIQQKESETTRLRDSLQSFDIGGYAIAEEELV